MSQASENSSKPLIERRSINYIPEAERHGKLYSQFTLWLGANLQITAIVTGALAVVLGGDVFWSLIGLLIGQLLGGAVMALHAAQGPKLGLPQMISSRVQFGVYGAAIPIVLVCLMYLGFTATGTVLSGQALGQLFGVSDSAGILIFASVIVLATVLGYRVIHFIGRLASIIGVIAFVYLFSRLMTQTDVGALLQIRHFSWSSFLLAVSLAASWQIAFGPYVADYSRYLPSKTSSVKTFLAVGAGSVIGAQVAMVLGVFAAAMANGQFAGREVAYIVGLGGSGATAALLYFSIAFGKVTISTLNSYGSFMCIATIISGFRGHVEVTPRQRLVFVLLIVGAATLVALLGQHSFLGAFKSFILFLLAFFTPWSAVNLVDYYLITRERYDVPALADPDGRYGRWNLPGISVYVIGVLVQLPFISTKFYTGPLVDYLGGVDISWIIGLVVPAVLYYLVARRSSRAVPDRLILPART
ncbi:nucleobase:cation symporter-1, NCS1 family [Pseudomonas citronellolis]|uniref:Nucleobase:cation symporter-1, NCS1 family n=2 Tax=Pseudomonas aeruginosa group TaxID=136841 RepID=A0AAQ1R0X5_9PSED|nr:MULTISPECIES: cytosine permease [Pseudomonas]MCL6690650.1 cytosine permease [Pseudomonas sp. R3.Fl]MCP1645127.1 NCS1 family nucleobase:cation symporter-1 [Pseudomonas citronellolis]MCP1665233.1 NCS1 family nucleobase:cation symporter-1 [Pseudomonas citronellolis]MCP1698667.1 NCS1 family nucleobase:cation symporter-1 [Pseudomonas citronellolis]MCP1703612.1 NCS1 family nucleobase:cation symporter-1 [Pseudomonas citronellolis]